MNRIIKKRARICLLIGSVLAMSGCNTAGTTGGKLWDPHAAPDWAVSSIEKPLARTGSIGDIIDSSGRCMADSFSAAKDPAPVAEIKKGLAPTAVALDMSECEIVKRAGPPDRIDIAVNERGERVASLAYADAVRPGLYRFRSGRLFSIERLPEPGAAGINVRPSPPAKRNRITAVAGNPEGEGAPEEV